MKTKLDITIPKDILDFLDIVVAKTKGYSIYLGGGYLRDLYYNSFLPENTEYNLNISLTPKDLDIFFVPDISFNAKDNVRELPVISKSYINYDTLAEDIPDMQERGVARVRGMFLSTLSTPDVQFIVYDKHFVFADQLAQDMDMNINQIMYDPVCRYFYVSDEFLSGHKDKVIECLHKFDETRMYNRYKRMQKKFPNYSVVTDLDMEYYAAIEKIKPKKKSGASSISFVD
jgi:hypothetical protein